MSAWKACPGRRESRPPIRLLHLLLILILLTPALAVHQRPGTAAHAAPVQPDPSLSARAAGPACAIDGPDDQSFQVEVCVATSGSDTPTGDVTVTTTITPVSGTAPAIRDVIVDIARSGSVNPPVFSSVLQDYAPPWSFVMPTYRWVDGTYLLRARVEYPGAVVAMSSNMTVTLANGVTTAPTSQGAWTPKSGTPGSPLVLAAVGDGAGGLQQATDVANLIDGWDPNLFLYLGDVYNAGKYTEFYVSREEERVTRVWGQGVRTVTNVLRNQEPAHGMPLVGAKHQPSPGGAPVQLTLRTVGATRSEGSEPPRIVGKSGHHTYGCSILGLLSETNTSCGLRYQPAMRCP